MKSEVRSQRSEVGGRRLKLRALIWGVCLSSILLVALSARAGTSKEYQIKAAFVYNFAKFVEWPPQRFSGPDAPIVIGIYGKNPFGEELANIVKDRKINSREVVVRAVHSVAEARQTHLLFVSSADDSRVGDLLDGLRGASVLTVGESDAFAAHSGMIQLLLESDKVRFEINADSAETEGLKISAQLLKLATEVKRKK